METIKIHYDCDTGQDDAIALLYALGSERIDVQSISVVGGNVDVGQCARNTLQILELAGREDIPVYIGADKPLQRPLRTLPEVFGVTGMAGAEDMPQPIAKPIVFDPAMDLTNVLKYPVMVATAPLTNLAMNIQSNSNFTKVVREVVIMGGSPYPDPVHGRMGNFRVGDSNHYAEYNFAVDPEAAKIVFSAGIEKMTLVGLNVTRRVLYNSKIEKSLLACGTKCAARAARILSAVGVEDKMDYAMLWQVPNDPVRALHDVVAMVCVDRPDLFTFETLPIRICIGESAGQSIIDYDCPDMKAVQVAVDVDPIFYDVFVDAIRRLG